MKIVITSQGNNLESQVDPRFGRCKYFIVYDTETGEFEVKDNEQNLNLPQGAGIQSGRLVVDTGAKSVVTGNLGPKAFAALNAAGIKIYIGASGAIKDVIDKFIAGDLKPSENANVEGHWM
ncbi:NifB/NifX family molybdenum-iron cluster-binding protein [bacterium]|nr:NifB/NifX family molybdenum-iron cluster-binding protein [bacterium]